MNFIQPSSTSSSYPTTEGSNSGQLSRYESQKRRDWNTFGQYLKNHRPPLTLSCCSEAHVLEFLRYLDQFGKTKVHNPDCPSSGHPNPTAPCPCPRRQAWGSLDALVGRLRAAYEESGGSPESNPFGAPAVRRYLLEVRDSQAKARGISYKKKRKPPIEATTIIKFTKPPIIFTYQRRRKSKSTIIKVCAMNPIKPPIIFTYQRRRKSKPKACTELGTVTKTGTGMENGKSQNYIAGYCSKQPFISRRVLREAPDGTWYRPYVSRRIAMVSTDDALWPNSFSMRGSRKSRQKRAYVSKGVIGNGVVDDELQDVSRQEVPTQVEMTLGVEDRGLPSTSAVHSNG